MIAVFYHLLMVIGDPIWFGGFKMGDEVLDQLGLGGIFLGHGVGGHLVLYGSHGF